MIQLTALIRTHKGREESCKRAIDSCKVAGVETFVYYDSEGPRSDYSYNLHCNLLKATVESGFWFFLDSDDFLIPGAVERIKPHLEPDKAIICQFLRGERLKPSNDLMNRKQILRGKIGMPCIILHHTHKDVATFGATEDADYLFIKEVANKMPVKWVKEALVSSPKRNRGL